METINAISRGVVAEHRTKVLPGDSPPERGNTENRPEAW